MIPRAHITAWRAKAPWSTDAQVEQDLVLSRVLVELFADPVVREQLAFRGGTALHKLFFSSPGRYSEDIDLVQIPEGPIGELIDAIRRCLDSWLGVPRRSRGQSGVALIYRFTSEIAPKTPLRVKIEVNTREHFSALGLRQRRFVLDSPWFSGAADIQTYEFEELLGTKLRALYQRKKGRDVFDLVAALDQEPDLDAAKVVACFERYLAHEGLLVSRAEFEANLAAKARDPAFTRDVAPLLSSELGPAMLPILLNPLMSMASFDADRAIARVLEVFVTRMRGDPWRGSDP